MKMTEDRLEEWLQSGTDDDLLLLARKIRGDLQRRIDESDSRGDGPHVNALCAAAREIFAPCLTW
jgi:hypothetical protein